MAAPAFSVATPIDSLPETDKLAFYDFWREHQRRFHLQPELLLLMAVLEDALKCYFEYAQARTRREYKLFAEAERWFFSESDETLFSFESVCAFLGIEPDYIRRGLLLSKNNYRHLRDRA
jgi:hypothetical protein